MLQLIGLMCVIVTIFSTLTWIILIAIGWHRGRASCPSAMPIAARLIVYSLVGCGVHPSLSATLVASLCGRLCWAPKPPAHGSAAQNFLVQDVVLSREVPMLRRRRGGGIINAARSCTAANEPTHGDLARASTLACASAPPAAQDVLAQSCESTPARATGRKHMFFDDEDDQHRDSVRRNNDAANHSSSSSDDVSDDEDEESTNEDDGVGDSNDEETTDDDNDDAVEDNTPNWNANAI